jgi:hypothetical protein
MRRTVITVSITAALALMATPALALPPQASPNPGAAHAPKTGEAAAPGASHRLAAPGQYCKAESKQHVAGQKGTPFSLCVKAQAKLRSGATGSPRSACKVESKKHVAGQKGTPFSLCVTAGARLLVDRDAQHDSDATATG